MKFVYLYIVILSVTPIKSFSKDNFSFLKEAPIIYNSEKLQSAVEASWFFIKPGATSLPLEMEILGKNQIPVYDLGVFNGISNTEKSTFFKLEKGIAISHSAVFGTNKIKTPRTNLAVNSALHFLNGAAYEFRDEAAGTTHTWENLSGHNLEGTVIVSPGANSHINGYVSYDGTGLFVYPLGNGINEYHPLTASGIAGKTITTSWLANDPSGNNDPTDAVTSHDRSAVTGDIKRVYPYGQWDWHVRSTAASLSNGIAPNNEAPSGSITISVNIPGDIDIITNGKPDNLRLVGWNGTTWESLNNQTINTGVISASLDKTLSAITYGAVDDGALPVNLISFSAHQENDQALLNWETASETNSNYFDVERSANGKNWNIIGKISAGGESNKLLTYAFLDHNPVNGENYYRLKMVDFDESFAYSRIQVLQFDHTDKIVLFPNPVSEILSIQTDQSWNTIANVSVYDKAGNLMYTSLTKPLQTIDVRQLTGGKYVVRVTYVNGTGNSYNIMIAR